MAKDVLITPASGIIEFKDGGTVKGSLSEDSGNLVISPTGVIVFGTAVRSSASASRSILLNSSGNYTWFRNDNNAWSFQGGTDAESWTKSAQIYLAVAGATGADDKWIEIGQRNSAVATGEYKGVRIVHYTGSSVVDGTLQAGILNITGAATIGGNLTVNGSTTTLNTSTLTVDDKNIELGSVATPTDTTADGGGITLKGATDKTIIWDSANANWTLNQNVNIPTGLAYKINNVSVLNATTLGASVVGSSLTSVGTLTSLSVNGNVGIGTTNPSQALHLYRYSARILVQSPDTSSSTDANIEIKSSQDYRGRGIWFTNATDSNKWFAGIPYTGGGYSIGYNSSQPEYPANSKLFIKADGKVGIGTTDPLSMLHLRGSSPIIYLTDTTTNAISSIDADSSAGRIYISSDILNMVANSAIGFMVDGVNRLLIDQNGALTPDTFTSGFAGSGWKIDYNSSVANKSTAEFDNLTIRGSMRVYELLINQIRATNGSVFISSTGKIATATLSSGTIGVDQSVYALTTDANTNHGFQVGDLIRAQRYTGASTYQVNLEVTAYTSPTAFSAKLIGTNAYIDAVGKFSGLEFVRLGSTSDANRRGSVYMTADDTGAPYIDIVDGIASHSDWNTSGKVQARLGKLTGITSPTIGALSGYGLWSDNIYLEGNANIVGTLAVGGGSVVGNTFYVGKIQKNLITYSQDMSQGAVQENWGRNLFGTWYINYTAVTPNYAAAPDGTNTACKFTNPRNNFHFVWTRASVTAGETYTFSVWMKTIDAVAPYGCYIKIATGNSGTLVNEYYASSGIYQGTTWKRLVVTFTIPASGVNQIEIGIGGNYYSGTSVLMWGAQLELGPTATPYQKTDATLSSSTGYGMWATAGGFGGTMQNPVVALGDYGMKVLGAGTAAALSNNSIMIGNITGSANSAIKLTNTGTQGTSGLFGYTSAGAESFALRLDGTAQIAGWNFNATDLSSGGIHLVSSATAANNKIYIGTGTYGNANTAFFVGGDGKFSLKDKLTWDGTTLTVNGGGIFTGDVSIGSGNAIFKADSNGIYLGNATFASAPFSVDPAGALKATNANIGSWLVDSNSISKVLFTTIGRADNVIMRWSSITEGTSQASWTYGANKLQGFGIYFNNGGPAIALHLGVMTTASGVKLDGTGNPYVGISMFDQSAREYFALGAETTSGDVYNRIAGWAFDSAELYSSNLSGTSDGTDYTTTGMVLGSTGYIAAPKFLLKTDGSALFKGTLSAPDGNIGGFTLSGSALYTGAFDTVNTLYFGSSGISLSNTFKVTAEGALTATSGLVAGWSLSATALSTTNARLYASGILSLGSADGYNTANSIYLDGANTRFSLGTALTFTGGTLTINGGGTFTGALSGGTISIGSGEAIFKADSNGIYLGSATFADAEFSVTPAGLLKAISGSVAGFSIDGTEGLYAGTDATRVQMKPGAGIWAGATAFEDAPFSVSSDGNLKSRSAMITGSSFFGGSIENDLFATRLAADLANWTAPTAPWAGSSLVTHCSSLDLNASYSATGTFNGKTVKSVIRSWTKRPSGDIDYYISVSHTSGTPTIIFNSQTYSYTGNIDVTGVAVVMTKNVIPFEDRTYNLGSSSNRYLTLYAKHIGENTAENDVTAYIGYLKIQTLLDAANVLTNSATIQSFTATASSARLFSVVCPCVCAIYSNDVDGEARLKMKWAGTYYSYATGGQSSSPVFVHLGVGTYRLEQFGPGTAYICCISAFGKMGNTPLVG